MSTVVSKFALAVVGVVASAASFAASPLVDGPSVAVRYDDLNLSTTAGVDRLYRRISAAARDVCPEIYSRDTHTILAAQRCRAAAITKFSGAMHSVSLPLCEIGEEP